MLYHSSPPTASPPPIADHIALSFTVAACCAAGIRRAIYTHAVLFCTLPAGIAGRQRPERRVSVVQTPVYGVLAPRRSSRPYGVRVRVLESAAQMRLSWQRSHASNRLGQALGLAYAGREGSQMWAVCGLRGNAS